MFVEQFPRLFIGDLGWHHGVIRCRADVEGAAHVPDLKDKCPGDAMGEVCHVTRCFMATVHGPQPFSAPFVTTPLYPLHVPHSLRRLALDYQALAQARYADVQSISRSVVEAVQALWWDVSPDRILSAMQGETGRQILAAVMAGQMSAAAGAQAFVSASILAAGAGFGPLGMVDPAAFVGLASDARPLATLLYLPAIRTATALAAGQSAEAASLAGLNQMATMVGTQIADTARAATSVAMAAEPRCVSYVRVVRLPACARCIILSGRQYSYSTGFKRHPRCDCGMEPMTDDEWRQTKTPEDLFRHMSPEEQLKRLGPNGVKALEAGADLGQIINARRGMATAVTGRGPMKVTTEGTTKRGIGAKAMGAEFVKEPGKRYARSKSARLMPETIFKLAGDNREHQIAMLKRYGYIV